jgi:hypothetical protein
VQINKGKRDGTLSLSTGIDSIDLSLDELNFCLVSAIAGFLSEYAIVCMFVWLCDCMFCVYLCVFVLCVYVFVSVCVCVCAHIGVCMSVEGGFISLCISWLYTPP